MAPALPAPERPTEVLSIKDISAAQPECGKPFWQRISGTMMLCLVVMTAFAFILAGLGLSRGVTGDPAVGWLVAAGGLLVCSFHAALFAGLRDWADQRYRTNVALMHAHVQCETYRIEQGQRRIAEMVENSRAELLAVLSTLPAGVIRYGDDRDDEGETRAVKRLAAANGTDGSRGIAPVAYLHTAPRQN